MLTKTASTMCFRSSSTTWGIALPLDEDSAAPSDMHKLVMAGLRRVKAHLYCLRELSAVPEDVHLLRLTRRWSRYVAYLNASDTGLELSIDPEDVTRSGLLRWLWALSQQHSVAVTRGHDGHRHWGSLPHSRIHIKAHEMPFDFRVIFPFGLLIHAWILSPSTVQRRSYPFVTCMPLVLASARIISMRSPQWFQWVEHEEYHRLVSTHGEDMWATPCPTPNIDWGKVISDNHSEEYWNRSSSNTA